MDIWIAACTRTPFGLRNGALSGWHPVDLLAEVLRAVVGVNDHAVDAVFGACASPIGEAAANVTRNGWLAAGFTESTPAVTVEAGLAGGMMALESAVTQLAAGRIDVAVVTAVDSSTRVPQGATSGTAVGKPYGPLVHDRYADAGGLIPPGLTAEKLAIRHGITAEDVDRYVDKALNKADTKPSVVGLKRRNPKGRAEDGVIDTDELRLHPSAGERTPLFLEGGVITAAAFRSDGDGAVAMVLCNAAGAARLGATQIASIKAVESQGSPPLDGSNGVEVALKAAKSADLHPSELFLVVSEDSAVTPLAFVSELEVQIANRGFLHTALPPSASGVAELTAAILDGGQRPLLVVQAGAEWTASAAVIT